MEPFGDDLSADQQIDFVILDGGNQFCRTGGPGERVARKNGDARFGDAFGNLFGKALHARTARGKFANRLTRRAGLWNRHPEVAMVAPQPRTVAVFDQPCLAIRALKAVTAGPAQRQRRITEGPVRLIR